MKIGDTVTFIDNQTPKDLGIGSGKAVGRIKDFDGNYVIIETGLGEYYIELDAVQKLNEVKKE